MSQRHLKGCGCSVAWLALPWVPIPPAGNGLTSSGPHRLASPFLGLGLLTIFQELQPVPDLGLLAGSSPEGKGALGFDGVIAGLVGPVAAGRGERQWQRAGCWVLDAGCWVLSAGC